MPFCKMVQLPTTKNMNLLMKRPQAKTVLIPKTTYSANTRDNLPAILPLLIS